MAASFAAFLGMIFRAFFGIHKEDDGVETGTKVTCTVMKRLVYAIADYWLMALSGAFIIIMDQYFGYGPVHLFILMWAFDIAVANSFVVIWNRTGQDVTLGESFRRAADVIYTSSRFAGWLAFSGVIIKAAFWDGPEHIVIFFNKELRTESRMLLALLALTAIQAAIWTPIYVLGFDTILDLTMYLEKSF